jgi:hypothetical protein
MDNGVRGVDYTESIQNNLEKWQSSTTCVNVSNMSERFRLLKHTGKIIKPKLHVNFSKNAPTLPKSHIHTFNVSMITVQIKLWRLSTQRCEKSWLHIVGTCTLYEDAHPPARHSSFYKPNALCTVRSKIRKFQFPLSNIYCFTSRSGRSRIFHLYYARRSRPLSRVGSLSCDTGPRFLWYHLKNHPHSVASYVTRGDVEDLF